MDLATVWREALDAAGVGLCVVDARGTVVHLNPTAASLLEGPAGRAVGRSWGEVVAERRPHLDALASPADDGVAAGVAERRLSLPRPDGTTAELEATVSTATVPGFADPVRLVLFRSLPQTATPGSADGAPGSSADWEGLFRDAPDILLLLRADGTIVDANSAAVEAYGYSRPELVTLGLAQLMPPAQASLTARRLAGGSGDRHGVYETRHMRRDRSTFPVEVRLAATASGAEGLLLCVVRDTTRRRRVEEAHRTALVGQIAAGVAHEVNNVFAGLVLQAERAALKDTVEAYRQLGELVPRAVSRGTEICQQLTTFSGPPDAARKVLAVEPIVEAALSVVAGRLESGGITVTRRWATRPAPALVAEEQVQQVFQSLLTNACDAMPNGGELLLRTSAEQGEDGRKWTVVEVRDDGVGIHPEHLPQVFTPFFTTKARLGAGSPAGIGLGLSVSRSIIVGHGGTIAAESEVGVGSSFRVRLPQARDPGAPEGGRVPGLSPPPAGRGG